MPRSCMVSTARRGHRLRSRSRRLNVSTGGLPKCRSHPSAIWLRQEFPVQRKRMRAISWVAASDQVPDMERVFGDCKASAPLSDFAGDQRTATTRRMASASRMPPRVSHCSSDASLNH